MNRLIIIAIFFFVTITACSQKGTEPNSIVLFDVVGKKIEKKRIEITDSKVLDSLKVVFSVVVNLEYPLSDTTKEVKVKSVTILRLSVVTENTQKPIIDFSYINDNGSDYQKYIWNLCNKKLLDWYRNQPYEKMIGRNNWDDRVVFGGVFYVIPQK